MNLTSINGYTDLELALMCLLGYLGNGADRKNALGTRYSSVQALVNQLGAGSIPKPTASGGGGVSTDAVVKALKALEPELNDYDAFINEVIDLLK